MVSTALVYDIFARDRASAVFAKVGAEAEGAGKKMHGMATALGVFAAVDITGHMLKMAGDFQKATSVLQTAAGETTKGLATVRKGILDIAQTTGTPWKMLTDGMYTVEKAGYRGAAGLQLLRAAAQGAAEENANLADVTNAMTSVMASYHLGAGQSVQVMNALKTAAGESKTTMEQYAGALSTVIPIASANKIGFDQVAGAIATLTQHGTSANEATQELANTIRNLAAPNQVAVKEMAQLGLSSVDVSQHLGQRGLTGTLQMLSETVLKRMGPAGTLLLNTFNQSKVAAQDATVMYDRMSPAAQKLAREFESGAIGVGAYRKTARGLPGEMGILAAQFLTTYTNAHGFQQALRSGVTGSQTYSDAIKKMTGGANGLNTTLQLTGENMPGFQKRVDAVAKSLHDGGTSVEGWRQTQGLFNTQMGIFRQTLDAAGISIGTAMLPKMIQLVGMFKDVIGYVTANKDWLLPIVKDALLVAGGLFAVTKGVGLAHDAFKALKLLTFGGSPVMIAIELLAVAAFLIYKNWGPISRFFERIWKDVAGFFERMWHDVSKFTERIWHDVTGWFSRIGSDAVGIWDAVAGWFSGHWNAMFKIGDAGVKAVTGWVTARWHELTSTVTAVWDAISGFFARHWRALLLVATLGLGLIYILIQDHWKTISGFTSRIWNDIAKFFGRVWNDIYGVVKAALTLVVGFYVWEFTTVYTFTVRVFTDVWRFFVRIWNDIYVAVHDAVAKVAGWLTAAWNGIYAYLSQQLTRLWQFFVGMWNSIYNAVHDPVLKLAAWLVTAWNGIASYATGSATKIWSRVTSIFGRFKDDVVSVFSHMVSAIGSAWDRLRDAVMKPVKFVVNTVYHDGIRPVWNAIAGVLHESSWKMPDVHFRDGGPTAREIRSTHQADSTPFFGQGGELVVNVPTVARHGGAANLMTKLGMDHFADGGILPGDSGAAPKKKHHGLFADIAAGGHDLLQGAASAGKGLLHGVEGAAGWVLGGLAHLARGALTAAAAPIIHHLESMMRAALGTTGAGGLINALGDKALNALLAMVQGRDSADNAASGDGGGSSSFYGGVKPWVAYSGHLLQKMFGVGTVYGVSKPSPYGNDHATGHALDFMTYNDAGKQMALANYLVGNLHPHNVQYLIARQRIYNASMPGWRQMEDRGSPTQNHMDHVHTTYVNNPYMDSLWAKAGSPTLGAMAGGAGRFAGAVGSGVARWRPMVDQILGMLHLNQSDDNGVLNIINHESTGIPTAVNLTDSNAQAGYPSRGLMQTIPQVFARWSPPYTDRGINDPFANVWAGIRYAVANNGEAWLAGGGNRFADGSYKGYDTGGWMPPGAGRYVNGTGRPEAVLTGSQWQAVKALAGAGAGGSGGGPVMHVEHQYLNDGVDVDALVGKLAFAQRSGAL